MGKFWITIAISISVVGITAVAMIWLTQSTADTPTLTNLHTIKTFVYFGNDQENPSAQDCGAVYPVLRMIGSKNQPLQTLQVLVAGPTKAERQRGYYSSFNKETRDVVRSVRIQNDIAFVNLTDVRTIIPNVSASCSSAQFLREVERTLMPYASQVVIAIEGRPKTLYEWLQLKCPVASDNCNEELFQ